MQFFKYKLYCSICNHVVIEKEINVNFIPLFFEHLLVGEEGVIL